MWKHRLTDKNIGQKTALCSNCGPVRIKHNSGTKYRCVKAIEEYRRIHGNRRKYHEPNPQICELCSNTVRVSYDHCHKTGKFRGWLCINCNTALGLVHDDPARLRQLAEYLETR